MYCSDAILHSFLLACVPVPSAKSNDGAGAGRGRGVISSSSCAPNVTAQLGLAARLFCCLATPELGQPGTQVVLQKSPSEGS